MSRADTLSPIEQQRYARHIALPELGVTGQLRLKSAKVLVVGAGGLGSPASLYLAAAGIGTLGIIDFDQIDLSNLQRQVLFKSNHVGYSKAAQAVAQLKALNPEITLRAYEERLDIDNIRQLVDRYDVVVDGTDNQETRYLLNDVCYFAKTPLIYGSIYRYDGQASVFNLDEGPCYRCLFPNPPSAPFAADCSQAGVLGILPAVVGSIQATEAIKLVTGLGDSLSRRLLLYNALEMRFDEIGYERNPNCALCSPKATIQSLDDALDQQVQATQCLNDITQISVEELADRLTDEQKFLLLDVRSSEERQLNSIAGSQHIPLPELKARANELDTANEVIVHCQAGARSTQACGLLSELGFSKVKNLTGGMDAWLALERN